MWSLLYLWPLAAGSPPDARLLTSPGWDHRIGGLAIGVRWGMPENPAGASIVSGDRLVVRIILQANIDLGASRPRRFYSCSYERFRKRRILRRGMMAQRSDSLAANTFPLMCWVSLRGDAAFRYPPDFPASPDLAVAGGMGWGCCSFSLGDSQ
jgi:hypothetical protein